MAWKVIGFMEGKEGNVRFPSRDLPVYGPLPRKVWVPVAGEKYKVRKPPAGPKPAPLSSDDARAIQYARWLAARDRIPLPDGRAVVKWDGITTRAGKFSKRVFSVSFHSADGKHGQIICLPNWDFDPVEPQEEIVSADIVFEDFRQRGWNILLQAA